MGKRISDKVMWQWKMTWQVTQMLPRSAGVAGDVALAQLMLPQGANVVGDVALAQLMLPQSANVVGDVSLVW